MDAARRAGKTAEQHRVEPCGVAAGETRARPATVPTGTPVSPCPALGVTRAGTGKTRDAGDTLGPNRFPGGGSHPQRYEVRADRGRYLPHRIQMAFWPFRRRDHRGCGGDGVRRPAGVSRGSADGQAVAHRPLRGGRKSTGRHPIRRRRSRFQVIGLNAGPSRRPPESSAGSPAIRAATAARRPQRVPDPDEDDDLYYQQRNERG